MNEEKLFHLGIDTKFKNCAKFAILPGDPARVDEISKYLWDVQPLAYNREYKSILAKTNTGISVIVCSTGIGGPSAAIAVEELAMLGVENFIRIGTCGGIALDVKAGDIVIATSSVRQEGTSLHYAPIEYPATADFSITSALYSNSIRAGIKPHIGVIQCKDSFYGQHNPERMPVSTELKEKWDAWKHLGVLASEMESSTIFCVASSLGLKAGTILSVVWNQERKNKGLSNDEVHDNNMAIKVAIQTIIEMGDKKQYND